MSRTHTHRRRVRPGIAALELTISMVLLLTAMFVVAQCVGRVSSHWRQTQRCRQALQLCNNALERASLLSWEDLGRVGELVAPQVAVDRLPEGALQLRSEKQADGGRRITAQVTWSDNVGSSNEVALTAWRYPRSGNAEEARP